MLTLKQIQQWRTQGYVIVSNLIEKPLLDKCMDFLNYKYPSPDKACKGFGSDGGELEFPSGEFIDWITVHPNIIGGVRELLGHKDILLLQSDAWGKTGSSEKTAMSNQDQRMHMDYGNNTFLHPSDWHDPEAVANIVYLSDIKDTGGGTSVVPRLGDNDPLYLPPYINMPGQHGYAFYNDRATAEEYMASVGGGVGKFRRKLYEREIITQPKAGDVLFYRLDIWHRGTPVKVGKVRNVMNLLWKKRKCHWINAWNPGWPRNMYYGVVEELFTAMSPDQRTVLGIPAPGDAYWAAERLAQLRARYPGIDLGPYEAKGAAAKL